MSEPAQHQDEPHGAHPHYHQAVQQVKDHKLITMVVISIVIALFLVFVAMALYNSSGAAQLDLSRPGYEDIRKKAQQDTTTVSFSATGTLDETALKEFASKYDKELESLQRSDVFATDALSQKSLQIDQDTAAASAEAAQAQ